MAPILGPQRRPAWNKACVGEIIAKRKAESEPLVMNKPVGGEKKKTWKNQYATGVYLTCLNFVFMKAKKVPFLITSVQSKFFLLAIEGILVVQTSILKYSLSYCHLFKMKHFPGNLEYHKVYHRNKSVKSTSAEKV